MEQAGLGFLACCFGRTCQGGSNSTKTTENGFEDLVISKVPIKDATDTKDVHEANRWWFLPCRCRRRSKKDYSWSPKKTNSSKQISPLPLLKNETYENGSKPPLESLGLRLAHDDPLAAEWRIVQKAIGSEEFEKLVQFRNLVAKQGLDSHPACLEIPHSKRAATLLRFLRARQGNLADASSLLAEAMAWRHDFQIDAKLKKWRIEWDAGESPRVRLLKQFNYVGYLGQDNKDLPVHVSRFSVGDPGGLAREIGDEALMLHVIKVMEDNFAEAQMKMLKTGRLLFNFVDINDVGSYFVGSWAKRALSSVPFYKKLAPILDKAYPERVRVAFILRAPRPFWMIWNMVLPLIPPATKHKIHIKGFKSETWLEEMRVHLPKEAIPIWLRSDDPVHLDASTPRGGIVPRGALT